MSNKEKKVPKLRFPGFTDDWERRKLGELGKVYTGNTPPTSDMNNWTDDKDGYVWITPTDIDKLVMSDSDRHLSEQGWSKARTIPEQSVLITSIASIGKNAINTVPVAFNQQINAIVPKENDAYFILSVMIKNTTRFAALAGQTATAIINKTSFEKFEIVAPNYEEQRQIGSFFQQLDNTITLHQRKLDDLIERKKGLLQKMFPQKGQTVPEIRFPGFTDDWEQRELGELANFLNGRAYKQQELLDEGKYRVLRVGNFNTNDRWYYSDLELDENKYADNGDLLYLWATNFGPEIWNEERVIYHYHIWKIEIRDKNLDKRYLYTWLVTDKERIKQTTNGTTMVHVTKGNMEERKFQFPHDITEQQKIGAFFQQLDHTITLHQRKLEHLQQRKKALLQQMFV